ncbi:hypothetical protein EVG20_g5482, partial [Dentipellis fragilis]
MAPVRSHGHTEYQRKRISNRSHLRNLIKHDLRTVSKQPLAQMSWKRYQSRVVEQYKVEIVGWPSDIPFMDPSDVSLGRTRLLPLIQSWEDGRTRFVELSTDEVAARKAEYRAKVAAGEIIAPKPYALRSDCGDRRPHLQKGSAGRHNKKLFYSKSARYIVDSDAELEGLDLDPLARGAEEEGFRRSHGHKDGCRDRPPGFPFSPVSPARPVLPSIGTAVVQRHHCSSSLKKCASHRDFHCSSLKQKCTAGPHDGVFASTRAVYPPGLLRRGILPTTACRMPPSRTSCTHAAFGVHHRAGPHLLFADDARGEPLVIVARDGRIPQIPAPRRAAGRAMGRLQRRRRVVDESGARSWDGRTAGATRQHESRPPPSSESAAYARYAEAHEACDFPRSTPPIFPDPGLRGERCAWGERVLLRNSRASLGTAQRTRVFCVECGGRHVTFDAGVSALCTEVRRMTPAGGPIFWDPGPRGERCTWWEGCCDVGPARRWAQPNVRASCTRNTTASAASRVPSGTANARCASFVNL